MFWKKDFWTESWELLGWPGTYRHKPMWKGSELLTIEAYKEHEKRLNELAKQLNLILDHLNLEYKPETEKKEPAKLVEKNVFSNLTMDCDIEIASAASLPDFDEIKRKVVEEVIAETKPKKKRKYVKSGKYSKKKK